MAGKIGDKIGTDSKVQSHKKSEVGMDAFATVHLSNLGKKEVPKNLREDLRQEFIFKTNEANVVNVVNGPKATTELCTSHMGSNGLDPSPPKVSALDFEGKKILISIHLLPR